MEPLIIDFPSDSDSEDFTSNIGSGPSGSDTEEERLIAVNRKQCHIASSSHLPETKNRPIDPGYHKEEDESTVEVFRIDIDPPKSKFGGTDEGIDERSGNINPQAPPTALTRDEYVPNFVRMEIIDDKVLIRDRFPNRVRFLGYHRVSVSRTHHIHTYQT